MFNGSDIGHKQGVGASDRQRSLFQIRVFVASAVIRSEYPGILYSITSLSLLLEINKNPTMQNWRIQ